MSATTQPQAQYYAVLNGSPPCPGRAGNLAVLATANGVNTFSLLNLASCPQDFYAVSLIIDARNASSTSQVQLGQNQFNINVAPGSYQAYTVPAFAQAPNVNIIFEDSTDSLFLIFANYHIDPQNFQSSTQNLPIAVGYSDASVTSTGASQVLLAANTYRLKVIIGVPYGAVLWVNFTGGTAGPNLASCFPIFPGLPYESLDRIPATSITGYCSPAGLLIPITVG